jgi:hypothetical protein
MSEQVKTLYVSHDCGCTYSKELVSDNTAKIIERAQKCDEQGFRWYIEDENGQMDYDHISEIHKGIFALMEKLKCPK